MDKHTILAKLRTTLEFSENAQDWLNNLPEQNWIKKDGGTYFFSEFSRTWEKELIESTQPIIQDYFRKLGVAEKDLPQVTIYESYKGSWIIESAITIAGSVTTAYYVLKGVSEIPEIIQGLTELKELIKQRFNVNANKAAVNILKNQQRNQHNVPPPPRQPLITNFVIDARPLSSLNPAQMQSHKLHLNVVISRDSLTIENLGEDLMRDIKIGVFKGNAPRNQWTYQESYMGTVDVLSPHQTIAKDCDEFRNSLNQVLDLSGKSPIYVDCWVQDSNGIYLFNFRLGD